jgi:hypothetical protein
MGKATISILGSVLAAVLLTANVALAEDAEQLIREGIRLRREQKDFEALPLFQRAVEVAPTPRAFAQLGLVEYALKRWSDSEEHLDRALAVRGDPWIEKNREILDQSVTVVRAHVADVRVRGRPAGARVFLNGRLIGTLPLTRAIRVSEGLAEVEVAADGYLTERRTLSLKGVLGQELTVELSPARTEAQQSRQDAHIGAPAVRSGAPQPLVDTGRGVLITGIIVSAATIGAGCVGYGVWQTMKVNDANHDSEATPGSPIASRAKDAQRNQWFGYGFGLAALGTAGALYLVSTRSDRGHAPRSAIQASFLGPRDYFIGLRIEH